MPTTTVPTLRVGTRINSTERASRCPIGTCVGDHDEAWQKDQDNRWTNGCGDHVDDRTIGQYGYSISQIEQRGETLSEFQRRFIEAVDRAQRTNGVNRDPVERAYVNLGIGDVAAIKVGDTYTRNTNAPAHSIIQVGDENDWSTFGMFLVDVYGSVNHAMGGQRSAYGGLFIRVGENVTERIEEPGDTDDPAAIRAWKVRAYKMSRTVKKETRWCGVLESTMRSLGLTEMLLYTDTTSFVSRDQAAELPEGTILVWQSSERDDCFQWFRRDNAVNGSARTTRIFGHRPDGVQMRNSMSRMAVVYNPEVDTEMRIPFDRAQLWEHLPVGTVFSIYAHAEEDSTGYEIHEDRRCSSRGSTRLSQRGQFGSSDFDSYGALYIMSLP